MRITWVRKSLNISNGECVEVAVPSGEHIDVRDSKNPQGAVLRFTPAQWNAFVTGVRSDAFDCR